MRVVFRADASARIGTGHVMRCLTLAQTLRQGGARASFVCREHEGHLIAALRDKSFTVAVLPPPPQPARGVTGDGDDYAAWLGVAPADDAGQTIQAIGSERPDWLVVDHYGIGAEWERRLASHAGRLLVIDDLANRPHECDALLDQNYSEQGARRYDGLVPARCQLLVGPRYALLAPEYASHRETQPPRSGIVRRVLVYFGGVDPSNTTGPALTALSSPEFRHLAVDLVIGTNHRQRSALEAQAAERSGTIVHGTRQHLADLMAGADIAIGAGGVTTWERMCLGLPSLVVSVAGNQRAANEALGAAGLIQYLGEASAVGAPEIRAGLAALLDDPGRLTALSHAGQALVDGRGAWRVADLMSGCPAEELIRTRQALHDADACPAGFDAFTFAWIDRCRAGEVLALRNMPHVTAQMRSREAISDMDHRRFLAGYHQLDRYDYVLIDTSRDHYVGVFYVTNISATPELGKYIGDAGYLGKGIARKATQSLIDFCRSRTGLRRLTSMTRADNLRNIGLNLTLGFERAGMRDDYAVMTMDLHPPDLTAEP